MKTMLNAVLFFSLVVCAPAAMAQDVQRITEYPAPYGSYKRISVTRQLAVSDRVNSVSFFSRTSGGGHGIEGSAGLTVNAGEVDFYNSQVSAVASSALGVTGNASLSLRGSTLVITPQTFTFSAPQAKLSAPAINVTNTVTAGQVYSTKGIPVYLCSDGYIRLCCGSMTGTPYARLIGVSSSAPACWTTVADSTATTNKSCTYNACTATGGHSAGACTAAQQATCNSGGACYYECNTTAVCAAASKLYYDEDRACTAASSQKITGGIQGDTIHCGTLLGGEGYYYIPACARSSGFSICVGGSYTNLACFPYNYAYTAECSDTAAKYYDCSGSCSSAYPVNCITSK